jgi:hypothetical protein
LSTKNPCSTTSFTYRTCLWTFAAEALAASNPVAAATAISVTAFFNTALLDRLLIRWKFAPGRHFPLDRLSDA